MMTLRARIFIIATVFVLVILAITLFLVVRNRDSTPTVTNPNDINTVVTNPDGTLTTATGGVQVEADKPVVVTDPVAVEKAGVEQLARVFTERYQTFSSDNNYENIRQLESMATPSLWKQISARLNVPPSTTFTGVTTDAFGVRATSFGGGNATVFVQTRRTTDQNNKVTVLNQNFTVQLVKNGNVWLVDSFQNAK